MFLSSIAKYYLSENGSDMSNLTFVFPSHRAGVFFRNALQKTSKGKVLLAPHITTISELLCNKTSLNIADNLTLTFELYNCYYNVFKEIEEVNTSFEFFYSWSAMFLGDFDDIDKYLVDAKQVYSNTTDYMMLADDLSHLSDDQRKAIEAFWQIIFDNDNDGKIYKKRFIDIYTQMYTIYSNFKDTLSKKNLAYDGMLYRMAVENINEYFLNDETHYVFVGFNALTEAEIRIFKGLQDAHKADFFWDYTPEMEKDAKENITDGCERFVIKHAKMFPSPSGIRPQYPESFPKINIINFAYPQGQVARVTDFVKRNYIEQNDKSTAIILTDENMLLPVLSAIPKLSDTKDKVNVTMGYPIKFSQVYGLADLLQRLQNSINIHTDANGVSFYSKIVQAILQHPCVNDICSNEASVLINKIIKENIIFVPISDFAHCDLLAKIFVRLNDSDSITDYVISIFDIIFNHYVNNDNNDKNKSILRECAYMVIKTANRFNDLITQCDTTSFPLEQIISTEMKFNMFISMLNSQTLDFCGMPLDGLQVMGILETRAVNFDKLIILDMNEGVFPKKSTGMTFIPSCLRHSFGLPTHEYQDAIFSYYFFRLIRGAKEVELLYTNTTDSEDRKGISRFILQLKYQYGIDMKTHIAIHPLNIRTTAPHSIKKNEVIMQHLYNLYCGPTREDDSKQKFISPSAFSIYIECPLKFYFSKIMRINEPDDIVEEAGNNDIGTIFHHVMERLYGGCNDQIDTIGVNKIAVRENGLLDDNAKKRILNNPSIIDALICEGFEMTLKLKHVTKDTLIGRNRLYYDIIYKCVIQLIQKEKNITFLKAEEQVRGEINIKSSNKDICVRLGGIIDRQHKEDDKHWVIDYKTGKAYDNKKTNLESLFLSKDHNKYKAIFQTMLYCKLLSEKLGSQASTLYPGIIWIQNLYKEEFNYNLNDKDGHILTYNEENKTLFDTLFEEKLSELFDPNVPFTPCEDPTNTCKYCAYVNLCHKTIGQESIQNEEQQTKTQQ